MASTEVKPADAFIIAVPTPLTEAKKPDLRFIQHAATMIAPHLRSGNLIVLESTSPVGTTEQLEQWLKQARPDLHFPTEMSDRADIQIAYCPERILPGRAMIELVENARVIGGLSPKCTKQAVKLYRIFAKGDCLPTTARTAELCKLAENSFRDVNIAFANELSMLCDKSQINVWELISLANRHPRVNILQPSAGVGGHCVAVDPYFMVAQSPDYTRLIQTARMVNEHKPDWVIEKVKTAVADCAMAKNVRPSDLIIACFGLAFKADIDDLRESPALYITHQLANWHKGKLWTVEPNLPTLPTALAKKTKFQPLAQALQADILVLLVDHHPFKTVEKSMLEGKWIVDCRGIWS